MTQMRMAITFASVWLIAAASMTGCAVTPTFSVGYTPDRSLLRPAPLAAGLAVRRFEDQRPPCLYTTQGRVFLTYVPLLPYVTLPYERMDENVQMLSEQVRVQGQTTVAGAQQNVAPPLEVYAYPGSIARAIADDLNAEGLFRDVSYVGGGPVTGYRYVLTGVLRESPLTQYATSFCLGAPGVLLWILPVPMQKTTGAITADLTLTDTQTGAAIWTHTLHGEVSRITTMYNSDGIVYGGGIWSYNAVLPPSDVQVDRQSLFAWHFEALRRAMREAKPSLAHALQPQ